MEFGRRVYAEAFPSRGMLATVTIDPLQPFASSVRFRIQIVLSRVTLLRRKLDVDERQQQDSVE